jgi:hypothetical protein
MFIRVSDKDIAMSDSPLPIVGARVRCINNMDRPELELGAVYVVVHDADIGKVQLPMNPKREYPDDYRWIAIQMNGQKDAGIYPNGIFEVVK